MHGYFDKHSIFNAFYPFIPMQTVFRPLKGASETLFTIGKGKLRLILSYTIKQVHFSSFDNRLCTLLLFRSNLGALCGDSSWWARYQHETWAPVVGNPLWSQYWREMWSTSGPILWGILTMWCPHSSCGLLYWGPSQVNVNICCKL